MKSSDFVFNYLHLLYYKCHKINQNRCGSYIDSPINKKDEKMFSTCCNCRVKS